MKKYNENLKIFIDYWPTSIVIILYFTLLFYSYYILGFNEPIADLIVWWHHSLQWYPFDTFHVPFFTLTVSLFRSISFNILKPLALMQLIAFIYFVISIIFIHKTILIINNNDRISSFSSCIFALWPFVGITQVVFPSNDIASFSLFFPGIYFLISNRILHSALFFGLSLIAHKVMWPLSFFVLGTYLLKNFSTISRKKLIISFILYVGPLALLWIFGWLYHNDPFWIISTNLEHNLSIDSNLIKFNGLAGMFNITQSTFTIIKGLIVICILLSTVYLLIVALKKKYFGWEISVGISSVIILLNIILNQNDIWVIVRFSRVLSIPLGFYLVSIDDSYLSRLPKVIIILGFLFLAISQFIFIWYISYYRS